MSESMEPHRTHRTQLVDWVRTATQAWQIFAEQRYLAAETFEERHLSLTKNSSPE